MYDYIVIGAGIVGSFIARDLSRYNTKTLVLEKENDVANVQTLANSAIIHSGHNPEPGTLKSKFCRLGNELYDQYEEELSLPLLKSGAYVVAHNEAEENQLLELVETTKANGLYNYELLDYAEAVKTEPNLASSITKVLSLPTTKVTFPWEVAFACMENAIKNGVEFKKNANVTNIEKTESGYLVTVNGDLKVETKYVINAAGVDTDDLANMVEANPNFIIHGRHGEYFVLDKRTRNFINHVLYPLPTDKGKGVLLTPQVHGEILVGPDSKYVDDKHRTNNTPKGLGYVRANAKHLADNVPFQQIIRSFAGIRATSSRHDFIIEESKEAKGFFHVAGIESPGLTAAPAISKYLIEDVMNVTNEFSINTDFNPTRHKPKKFGSLSFDEQQALIAKDPTYANIICKCEKITEREVIDAITGPLGSDTIKGVKKRARCGAGLCQGGYCEEKVYKMIADLKNKTPLEVCYDGPKSNMFVEETKVTK